MPDLSAKKAMPTKRPHNTMKKLSVRPYQPADAPNVWDLYHEGLLTGRKDPDDLAADLSEISRAYLSESGSHFWIAESAGRAIGMVGLLNGEPHVGRIRRLRVAPDCEPGLVAARLLGAAIDHCREHELLKVILDTRISPELAVELLEHANLHYHRTWDGRGKRVLEFYLDLYRQPEEPEEDEAERPCGQEGWDENL